MSVVEYRRLKSGDKVSAIGIGTWDIRDYKRAEDVLVEAITLGINLVDTAEMYGNGLAEEMLGRVVKKVGRDSVFITTKLLPWRFRSEEAAERAIRASLRRLGVSYVDALLIHWPDELTPIEVQVRILERLWEKGYARLIGVSNFDKSELEKAMSATSKAEIVIDQVYYSVLCKHVELDLLPFAEKYDIVIQAYTPLERCRVSKHPMILSAAKRVGRTPVQVALNYLLSRSEVVVPIPKTERKDHLYEILGSMGWRLPRDILETLSSIPDECPSY